MNIEDITERIKTFEDACEWCKVKKPGLYQEYLRIERPESPFAYSTDLYAYLKLRIITAALNEGWEPRFDGEEEQYFPFYGNDEIRTEIQYNCNSIYSKRMAFKTNELALYAATQFRDIYADFCGCKKGGEE